MNAAVVEVLVLAADNHLFQVRNVDTDRCEYRDDQDRTVDDGAVRAAISYGWIGQLSTREPHGDTLLRRRLDLSDAGMGFYLSGVGA